MPNTRWVSYKSYSGYVTTGGPKIDQPVNSGLHIDRAVYLSGQLEAGSWGTVQGYDGCAMSGGILHNIAVSPKDLSQGTFFALLREISVRAKAEFAPIDAEFKRLGWTISADGKLRLTATGALVSGETIRLELSGSAKGAVLKTGPDSNRARVWAERFFTLFSAPGTYAAQSDYAASWLADGNKGDELAVYRKFSTGGVATFLVKHPGDSIISLPVDLLPVEVELAMCVYHSFSVNAPGAAKAVLSPILGRLDKLTPAGFATALIRGLGKKQYGNWLDSPGDGSNRYDKTRKAVWARSDLWNGPMAKSLMPKDL